MDNSKIPDDDTGQALKRWASEGSDLNKLMRIDFFISVDNKSSGEKIAAQLNNFDVSIDEDDESGSWTCYCTKTMIPDYHSIVKVENLLAVVAEQFGASYDGFGSYGNK